MSKELLAKYRQTIKDQDATIYRLIKKGAELESGKVDSQWRTLALQFDNHRMQAMQHLKQMIKDPEGHSKAAAEFVAAPPLMGQEVLAKRIKELLDPIGYAGVIVWIGNKFVRQVVADTQIQYEKRTGCSLEQAAHGCLHALECEGENNDEVDG